MLRILHIVHIYIDPSQLTFVFAEGLIDSDEDVSSTHTLALELLDPMNSLMVKIVPMENHWRSSYPCASKSFFEYWSPILNGCFVCTRTTRAGFRCVTTTARQVHSPSFSMRDILWARQVGFRIERTSSTGRVFASST